MALISSSSHINSNDGQSRFSINQKVMTLPRIEHPSLRIDEEDQNSLDIRGKSRNGQGIGKLLRSESSTPPLTQYRRKSSSFKRNSIYSQPISEIPSNVNVIYGEDRDKVRLPIFGRQASSTHSSYRSESSHSSPMTSRIGIDELEITLREKVRSQIHNVRTKFRHGDNIDSNGSISRQALEHLIASLFGTQRQIGPNQIDKLLERLHLKDFNKISFDQFVNSLFPGEDDLPSWVSRQSSHTQELSSKRSAAQIFIILKDKIRTKHKDLVSLCPSLDGGSHSTILKSQFHNTLINMGYRMKDKEFDKLWDKFDPDGFHSINSEKFVKRLTNEPFIDENPSFPISESQDQQLSILRSSHNHSQMKSSRLNTARNQLDESQIETWLNHKFPDGFSELENSLERLDTKQIGTLPRDRFVEQLKRFGFKLEEKLLEFFLKRLNIDLTLSNGSIPYRDVINAFKQRTDRTKKRINAEYILPKEQNRQTSLERQVEYLISTNYDRIHGELIRLDNNRNGTINNNDMRSLCEDLLEFPLRADEYYQLLKKFPTDENGKIKYKEYLKQVMDRTTQFQREQEEEDEEEEEEKEEKIPQWEYMRSKHIRESLNQEYMQKKKRVKSNDSNQNEQRKARSIEQLREIVKRVIRDRYKDIEEEFKIIDRGSYGELTQDLLLDLFKRLHLKPSISREEIILLWSRCHLKENGKLDFYQFLREFGYSKHSAHYPNAKQNPPRRGDADFLLTSRKLYGDSVLVHGTVINAIKSNWEELREEFTQLDPYRTGFIQTDEFDDILTELCPSVNQEDLDLLKFKFQTKNDSRMNYVKFLKHHAPIPELIDDIDQGTRKSLATIHDNSPRNATDRSALTEVCNKLRRKLSDSSKQLRRAFKQEDQTNSGLISVLIFKQILNQFKCYLNDEEFYTLTSQIDTKMNGTINYNYFIQQYLKNI